MGAQLLSVQCPTVGMYLPLSSNSYSLGHLQHLIHLQTLLNANTSYSFFCRVYVVFDVCVCVSACCWTNRQGGLIQSWFYMWTTIYFYFSLIIHAFWSLSPQASRADSLAWLLLSRFIPGDLYRLHVFTTCSWNCVFCIFVRVFLKNRVSDIMSIPHTMESFWYWRVGQRQGGWELTSEREAGQGM